MYVCMYVCMYVYIYIYIYVCMYACANLPSFINVELCWMNQRIIFEIFVSFLIRMLSLINCNCILRCRMLVLPWLSVNGGLMMKQIIC